MQILNLRRLAFYFISFTARHSVKTCDFKHREESKFLLFFSSSSLVLRKSRKKKTTGHLTSREMANRKREKFVHTKIFIYTQPNFWTANEMSSAV